MKVFINTWNLLTWPKAMAEYLSKIPEVEIIFIDNASTWEPLLEWYETRPYKIYMLPLNAGHTAGWTQGIIAKETNNYSEYYCYSDADADLSTVPPDFIDLLLDGAKRYPNEKKWGLGIIETGVPHANPAWDFDLHGGTYSRFAGCVHLEGGFNSHPVDTWFALYPPGSYCSYPSGISTEFPYSARHLMWHVALDPEPDCYYVPYDDEFDNYVINAGPCSTTVPRLKAMSEEYNRRKLLNG